MSTSLSLPTRRAHSGPRNRFARSAIAVMHFVQRYALSAIFLVGLVLVWQLVATAAGLQAYILPKPSSVVSAAITSDRSVLLSNAKTTLLEIVIGFGVAVVSGFLVAVLLASNRTIRRA